MGIIPLRAIDPDIFRAGPHAPGGAVVPDLVGLESRVQMARNAPVSRGLMSICLALQTPPAPSGY
jgi:hypothetical protein